MAREAATAEIYQLPLFESAHAALTFAFQFSSDQYDRPMMNRMSDGPRRQGKGLAGLDGAAQAGMIRAEVQALGRIREAVITAWFSPRLLPCSCRSSCCAGHRINHEWSDAITILTQAALGRLSGKVSHYQLRRGIVVRNFKASVSLVELAEKCGVNRDTASDHNAIVTSWLSGKKPKPGHQAIVGEIERSLNEAGKRLFDAGITQSP